MRFMLYVLLVLDLLCSHDVFHSSSALWSQRARLYASPAFVCLFDPQHDKTNNMAYAPSEDSDQPGHAPRLIWVFARRTRHFAGFVMRRLICTSYFQSLSPSLPLGAMGWLQPLIVTLPKRFVYLFGLFHLSLESWFLFLCIGEGHIAFALNSFNGMFMNHSRI